MRKSRTALYRSAFLQWHFDRDLFRRQSFIVYQGKHSVHAGCGILPNRGIIRPSAGNRNVFPVNTIVDKTALLLPVSSKRIENIQNLEPISKVLALSC